MLDCLPTQTLYFGWDVPLTRRKAGKGGNAQSLSVTATSLPSAFRSKHFQFSINTTTTTQEVQHSNPGSLCRPSLFRLCTEQVALPWGVKF